MGSILNLQLLTEMDGFESDSGVLVLAATNRPEALDPALCRPGRLSRRVHVTEPDLQGRQQVLAVHMRGVPVEEDPLLLQRLVASMTGGFVGADLANLVNEAALLAARKGIYCLANPPQKCCCLFLCAYWKRNVAIGLKWPHLHPQIFEKRAISESWMASLLSVYSGWCGESHIIYGSFRKCLRED